MCKITELLPLSQESISTVTWSICIILSGADFILLLFLGKPSKTVGMPCHFWAIVKKTAVAHKSLIWGLLDAVLCVVPRRAHIVKDRRKEH